MTISESSEERAPRRAEIEKAGGHEAKAIGPLPMKVLSLQREKANPNRQSPAPTASDEQLAFAGF